MKNKPRPEVLFAAAMIGLRADTFSDREDDWDRADDALWRIWETMTEEEKRIHNEATL